jgi:hypothetical protein
MAEIPSFITKGSSILCSIFANEGYSDLCLTPTYIRNLKFNEIREDEDIEKVSLDLLVLYSIYRDIYNAITIHSKGLLFNFY